MTSLPAYSPPGSWNNERASDNCNPCAPGKYSDTTGSTECKVGFGKQLSAGKRMLHMRTSSGCRGSVSSHIHRARLPFMPAGLRSRHIFCWPGYHMPFLPSWVQLTRRCRRMLPMVSGLVCTDKGHACLRLLLHADSTAKLLPDTLDPVPCPHPLLAPSTRLPTYCSSPGWYGKQCQPGQPCRSCGLAAAYGNARQLCCVVVSTLPCCMQSMRQHCSG